MLRSNGPARGTACYDNLAVQGYGVVPLLQQKATIRATQLMVDGRFCHLYYIKNKCTFYFKRLF